jgi:hypothetical protein
VDEGEDEDAGDSENGESGRGVGVLESGSAFNLKKSSSLEWKEEGMADMLGLGADGELRGDLRADDTASALAFYVPWPHALGR